MMYTRGLLEGRDRDEGMFADAARAEVVSQPTRVAVGLWRAVARRMRILASRIAESHERNATIRELQALDDRLLKDIGIHRGQIPYLVEEKLSREREAPGRFSCRG